MDLREHRGWEVAARVSRRAAERKYWQQEVAELLLLKGMRGPDKALAAVEYAESLLYRNVDENGELTASPQEAVEDDLIYPYATMS